MVVASANSTAQIRLIPQERLDSVANPPIEPTHLQFPAAPIRMGEISEEGGLWHGEVVWRNGEKGTPVVITGVQSSCGCLRAEYDREPVKAGDEGRLRLIYNPKGRPGSVEQRLFVYTSLSASKPSAVVRLQGYVTPAADKRGRYPKVCGELLLRQNEVQMAVGEREVRIACLNGGDRALRITEDRLLTPRGFRVTTEPEVLSPGVEGDLVIRLGESMPRGVYPILLDGLTLPPRMRTIRVQIGDNLGSNK